MGCPDPRFFEDLDPEELDSLARADLQTHVKGCEKCRRELAGRTDRTVEIPRTVERSGEELGVPQGLAVGAFEVVELIGSGAVGTVYRARPSHGGEDVALKLIAAEHCDERVRRRFERETRALGELAHPNVVRVLDFGPTPDGGLYLAMELLDGQDLLRHILERGALPVDEVVRIGCAAAAALGTAHRAGFVHRDVKPANLFVCTDLRMKVLDFGLAVRAVVDGDTRMTSSGVLLGTPAYMAIEQAIGQRDEDARTDVWGLGATLYHALCGRTPFAALTITAQLVRVVSDEPTPLPETVPRWLARTILRALAKDRAERWQSMEELAAALREGLAGDTTGTLASSPTAGATAVALEDEVRIVSLLLANEVESVDAFRRAVLAEQGTAWPLLGHRAIGVVGGEAWRGDEAERAVRAGLTARSGGAARRLGVATGRAFRARAGALTGEVVAAAQRVLRTEGVGVDPETQQRIRGSFAMSGDIVVATRPRRRSLAAAGPAGAGGRFAGRDRELGDLRATFAQVAGESQAAGVLVIGPPGIGKSRLCAELIAHVEGASPTTVVLEAAGESNRTLEGWHAIGSALRAHADLPEGTPADAVRERLLAICPSRRAAEFVGEILGADFPETAPLANARRTPGVMKDQILLALGDTLEALTEQAPVLLALEDAHWADARTLEAVDVLLRRLDRHPLLVVATSRTEVEPLAGLRRMALEGISRAATRTLVAEVVGDEGRADSLHERSGGNPYFAQELARALREGSEDLPASIGAAMQARLDVLPREQKDLLRRASVLGARFWVEALEALGCHDVPGTLAALRRRDLALPEPRPRLAGTSEWRFRHALVQEVAYGSLTRDQHRALHRQASQWLAARADAPALEVARHLEVAGDGAAAAEWFRRAAEAAGREGDSTAALEASSRALPFMTDPAAEFALRRVRADLLFFLGRSREHQIETEALEALASSDAERMAAMHNRVRALELQGRRREAVEVGMRALSIDPDDVDVRAEVALALAHDGHPQEALAHAEQAVEQATTRGDHRMRGRALRILASCYENRGDFGPAMPLIEQALAAFEAAGNPRSVASLRTSLAYFALSLGRHTTALADIERTRVECRAVGNLLAEGYAVEMLGLARARCGDVEGGLQAEQEALGLAIALGEHRLEMAARTVRGAILVEADRHAEALETLDEALRVPEDRQGQFAPELHGLKAAALVGLGRLDEARVEASTALALREQHGGLEQFEAHAFLAADAAGLDGALAQGVEALVARAARLPDESMRTDFLRNIPDNARLLERARSRG